MQTASHGHNVRVTDSGVTFQTPFDYLFQDLQGMPNALLPENNLSKLYESLDNLGNSMVPVQEEPNDSQLPPILTYWGQFIDHDITLNTDRDSRGVSNISEEVAPKSVDMITSMLINGRQPFLNLDSLYGDAPSFDPAKPTPWQFLYNSSDPTKFVIGRNTPFPSQPVPPPAGDLSRDFVRLPTNKSALIADARNDENLIVAQFHLAWLKFHNAMVDGVKASLGLSGEAAFEKARDLVRFHYQWLVVNQYLELLTMPGTVQKALNTDPNTTVGRNGKVFTPLEFSVAAFRFGHSMIRERYDYNRNFGRGDSPAKERATLDDLFIFTGRGGFRGLDTLLSNWIIEWDRFITVSESDRSARKVDTNLNPLLGELLNEGSDNTPMDIVTLQKNLARRNLRRGFQLRIPTGQAMAIKMEIPALTEAQMLSGNAEIRQALEDGGFVNRTPLWFYILKEAEVQNDNGGLGELGSKIVAQTIVGLIQSDPESYLTKGDNWSPDQSEIKMPDGSSIDSLEKVLKFAGVL